MGLFSLDLLFKKIREYDLRDRVTISHAWCLANLPDTRYQPIAEAFQELGIGIITHVPATSPFPPSSQAGAGRSVTASVRTTCATSGGPTA